MASPYLYTVINNETNEKELIDVETTEAAEYIGLENHQMIARYFAKGRDFNGYRFERRERSEDGKLHTNDFKGVDEDWDSYVWKLRVACNLSIERWKEYLSRKERSIFDAQV